eukprot:SAG31_NODE_26766_length_437_cov_0.458580_1_plen_69_part_01
MSNLVGQDSIDLKPPAQGLPPPDSLDMWPMIVGTNSTSPRVTLVLRAIAGDQSGAIIKKLKLPGASVSS